MHCKIRSCLIRRSDIRARAPEERSDSLKSPAMVILAFIVGYRGLVFLLLWSVELDMFNALNKSPVLEHAMFMILLKSSLDANAVFWALLFFFLHGIF